MTTQMQYTARLNMRGTLTELSVTQLLSQYPRLHLNLLNLFASRNG